MLIRSSFSVLLIFSLFIHTLYGINPAYFQRYNQRQQIQTLIDAIQQQLDEQHINSASSEINQNNNYDDNNDEDEQYIKRNRYPNFHVSPLWLSRRTRTNRFYG
ncbi:unnamed protein product, partial [Adineta steineri]